MPFKSLGAVSCSPSIVTMAVSVVACEIFSIKEWCYLENGVRARSRSLELVPCDRSLFTFHSNYGDLASFARYSDLLVENREMFIPHLYLSPPQRVTRQNFVKMFDADKTRMIGLPYGEKYYDNMLSCFHLIPERDGQTDRRTELLYQYRASVC